MSEIFEKLKMNPENKVFRALIIIIFVEIFGFNIKMYQIQFPKLLLKNSFFCRDIFPLEKLKTYLSRNHKGDSSNYILNMFDYLEIDQSQNSEFVCRIAIFPFEQSINFSLLDKTNNVLDFKTEEIEDEIENKTRTLTELQFMKNFSNTDIFQPDNFFMRNNSSELTGDNTSINKEQISSTFFEKKEFIHSMEDINLIKNELSSKFSIKEDSLYIRDTISKYNKKRKLSKLWFKKKYLR